jgi:HSP20 family protein
MEEKMRSRMSMVPLGRRPALWGGLRDEGHPLDVFHREFDRLFEDMWRGFDRPMRGEYEPSWAMTPTMDVAEDDDEVRLSVELPGMDEEDVEIILSDDVLTIKGEKKVETERGEKTYSYKERAYGSFRRSLPLGANILTDKIEAHFDKGVLTITLPKVKRLHKKAA